MSAAHGLGHAVADPRNPQAAEKISRRSIENESRDIHGRIAGRGQPTGKGRKNDENGLKANAPHNIVFPGFLGIQKKRQEKLSERAYEERPAAKQGDGHCGGIELYRRRNAEGIGQGHHDGA